MKKNVPSAFESPRIVKKQKISPKPVGTSKEATKQRFITDEDYMHILGLLQDCGKTGNNIPKSIRAKVRKL